MHIFLLASVLMLSPQTYTVKALARIYIDNPKEFKCYDYIITRESRWNPKAKNPRSTAYGLAQMLNEKNTDAFAQVLNSLRYIEHRYGSICVAASHHRVKGWY